MWFRRLALAALVSCASPVGAFAQSTEVAAPSLSLELNAVQDVGGACRLTFVAQNQTGTAIDDAIFETVIFDTSGAVVSLSLFDFREVPVDRLRVRQFDLSGRSCDTVGKALINGANTCVVEGADSTVCDDALELRSRVSVELIG